MIIRMGSRLSRSNLTQLIYVFYSSLQSRENCLFWVWKFLESLRPLPCFMVLSKNLIECTIIIAAVVQLLSHVWLFMTLWTAAGQASLSLTISKSLPKFMSIELVMLSNHLILYCPLLLLLQSLQASGSFPKLASGGQSIGASGTSASVFPMSIQGWFPLELTSFISLVSRGLSRVFSSTTIQKHHFFSPSWVIALSWQKGFLNSMNQDGWVTVESSDKHGPLEEQMEHHSSILAVGFPHSSVVKESACNAGDPSSIPGSGRSPGEGIGYPLQYSWASLVAQLVKNPPAMRETWVQSLHWEYPLEKGKATHSNILAGEFHGL